MEYKLIEEVSYNLHLIKTNKFKTLFFKVILSEKIEKQNITKRNLLVDNLLSSSKDYPSMRQLSIKKQDVYGASISMTNRRIGNHTFIEYIMSILNPKYTEDTMLEESIKFYSDILYRPNVVEDHFDEEIFEMSKESLEKEIIMTNENPNLYAFTRFKETMDEQAAFSFDVNGYLEDLEKITSRQIYDYYNHVLDTNCCDIYVVGDFDFKEIRKLIKKYFHFNNKTKADDYQIKLTEENATNKEKIEEGHFNQSKLYVGFKIANLDEYEKQYTLILFNIIFGNSPESKLFKNIREKNSFSYSINSAFRKLDNFYYINAGISNKNYEQVIKLIKQSLEEMRNGEFAEEELIQAKTLYTSILKDTFEGPGAIADMYFNEYYFNNDNFDERIKKIEEVSKEQIIEVSKKLEIDTIYLLKEGDK